VCFGTDAFLYDLEAAGPYVALVRELGLPEEVEAAVFWDNTVRFLGSALPEQAGSILFDASRVQAGSGVSPPAGRIPGAP
jgi:hypothetical protein